MKKLICLLAFLLVFLFPAAVYGATNARLIIDYEEVHGLDVPPIMMNNRVMVPARGVFERMGGVVEWNDVHRQITIRYNGYVLIMTIGETIAWHNGEVIIMDVPPVLRDNHTLIPLRFPAEAFGFDVDWDSSTQAAIINSGVNNPNNGDDDSNIPEYVPEYIPEYPQEWPTHQPDGHLDTPPPEQDTQADPNLATDISTTPIQAEQHPVTNITNILTPRDSTAMAYTIVASSAISDVNHFLLPDNRLVVDIYNAMRNVNGPFLAYGPVREVRTSQFARAPYVTRVVFELAIPTEFSVALSADRRNLTIAFTNNNITVTPTAGTASDVLTIRGAFQPSTRLCAANYPNFLSIYVDNATIEATGEFFNGGAFVSHYILEQSQDGVVAVRVFMSNEWPAISLNHGLGYVTVALHGGLNGIRYDFWSRELRICRTVIPFMDINSIRRNDEYLRNRYTITLPVGTHGLGLGNLYVADSRVNSITVRRTSAGYAQIIFDTSRVLAFTIHETHDEYIIRARLPQDIHPFIIVIDPGHGGRDPGTVHHGLRESDIVLNISHLVAERLSHHPGIQVYMTRHTDVFVALAQRPVFANQIGADLFLSIHVNAVRNRPHVTGIETWYLPNARENNLSVNSHQFARFIQSSVIDATSAVDRGIKNTSNFVVLRDTRMPAALIEVGFLSNAQEASWLGTNTHQRLLAQAIYEGILEAYAQHRR